MKFILVILLFITINVEAQVSTIMSDKTTIRPRATAFVQKITNSVSWKIQGQAFKYGYDPINVEGSINNIDTIYYTSQYSARIDTIICNINKSENFQFRYNSCCSFFNLSLSDSIYVKQNLKLELMNVELSKKYLVKYGEMGRIVIPDTEILLTSYGRSAMSSQVFELSIYEIDSCMELNDCKEIAAFIDLDGKYNYDGYKYKEVKMLTSLFYLPLNRETDVLVYNLATDSFHFKE
ncbi:hypothetical protein N9B82_00355 [Saprospiraceae bacterium]|nr:hypothetical protein [Saprospiraceae bacterium]